MLTKDENELITRTGPGTPMGELFRRFWLPALLSEELVQPDSAPVRVRLLGEDLVAFRNSSGEVGIFDAYCPHRNAPLFFGRNEEDGLRCVYHGWKFDVKGNCVDMPNVPEGEIFKDKTTITSYPTFEGAGIVFIYMGPKDKQPPRPGFDWIDYPTTHSFTTKYFMECNYLQTLENEWGDGHTPFLHSQLRNTAVSAKRDLRGATGNSTELLESDFGAVMGTEKDHGRYSLHGFWMIPVYASPGVGGAPGTQAMNIKVPTDDTHCAFFRVRWAHEPLTQEALDEYRHGHREFPEHIPGTYVTSANKRNDYVIDRTMQKHFNYTGINPYPIQDMAMVEDQRGSLADRSRERLVSSDKFIIYARRRLLDLATDLKNGHEPIQPWQPELFRGLRNFEVITPEERGYRFVAKPQAIAAENR